MRPDFPLRTWQRVQNRPRKRMKPQSAKQKGRNLQKWVVQAILSATQGLTSRDVVSTSMGAGGADVKLSEAAFKQFPYSIECKNRKTMKSLYDAYKQAGSHGDGEPLLVVKTDREKPLVVMDADHFFTLIRDKDNV